MIHAHPRPATFVATLALSLLAGRGATLHVNDHGASPAVIVTYADSLPLVRANDNRTPAGTLRDGVLTLRLVVQMARWQPEAEGEGAPLVIAPVFAEEGRAPQIPGPLVRVPAGTSILATVRNALSDSTITVRGLQSRPADPAESVTIAPGATHTFRFAAGAPGTYLYSASAGVLDNLEREREQLAGALVIDSAGGRSDDRIFVINIWGEPIDSIAYRNALAINGRAWPHTERLAATVGDSLRWRVINASARSHPMHMHGFYFRVDAKGDAWRDTVYAPGERRLAVTETLFPSRTMSLVLSPSRPGNWIFHCHLAFHVVGGARLDAKREANDRHAHDPNWHMAGLVLGFTVADVPNAPPEVRTAPRRLRLFINEGPKRSAAPRALGFVLQQGDMPPARDSVVVPGSLLVLTRGEPTDITVFNRLKEVAAIHWHGIELESYSDGVPGLSGIGTRVAPAIAPSDSFTARLTLPRAGTFIYHTHVNDVEQLTSGLYGAIIVREPDRPYDPATDHPFTIGWDGEGVPPRVVVNGDTISAPLRLAFGVAHRLRLVNISPAGRFIFSVRRDTTVVRWRALAKDGADLPPSRSMERRAAQAVDVGETYDFEFTPSERGEYLLSIAPPTLVGGRRPARRQVLWTQQVIVQ
ncbi:MAG: multicopper oxidase domain-containing protein [Gemmatimonadota bacterium]|nr:multicopper oxidase domain-containing protein [Gemmatimonadota bacterium]